MTHDEIVRALRNCKAYKTRSDLQTTMLMAADLIESLQARLVEYDALAAEYGIDGKTMLTLAESQIKTAKENIVLREALEESQCREKAAVEDIMCNDRCDVCLHKDGGTSCERVDLDCAECDDPVCVCRCCRNEDKWEWRGNAE